MVEVTAARSLAGLTIGAAYRFKVKATKERGEVKLIARESGGTIVASSAFLAPTAGAYLELIFTPTQTTMVVQLNIKQTTALYVNGVTSKAGYRFTDITVAPSGTWLGTTIYRTDANGVDVPVRNPRPYDVEPATTGVTLLDFEAALVGVVSYRVVDGLGGTATATAWHGEMRRNAAPNPRAGVDLAGWVATYGTTGAGTLTRVTTGGPRPDAPTFARATWTTSQTVSNASVVVGSATAGATEILVTAAEPATFGVYLRPSIAGAKGKASRLMSRTPASAIR